MSPRPKVALELSAILEAAGKIADTEGIQEVTLANLAKKLNIKPPSLYNHLDGLPGLRKQLAIYGLNMLYNEFAQAAVGVSGEEAVLSLGRAYVAFARKHPGIYEATLQAPNPEEEESQQAAEKIISLFVRVLQSYHLEGEFALHAVRGLRSIVHGFASLEQREGFKLSLDLDKSLTITIKAFLAGIGTI